MSHKSKAKNADATLAEPAACGSALPDLEYVGQLFAQLERGASGAPTAADNEATREATHETTVTAEVADAVIPEECTAMTTEPDDAPLALPAQCLLRDAVELKNQLLEGASHPELSLNVSAVERVDGAFMQVLVSLVKQRRGNSQSAVQFVGSSAALHDAARVLGLQSCIALPVAAT
jgi:ABC-type transporter Mla MlaB component